ncbi:MAG: asparagine--tRNA ligase [Candidatus Edwardsbacteria bacterium]|jgi:asparaginyl-tRNA synthetase|nr:asparagine--tRNA ligase [Candidatus Edwardsbacteria bacterium]
MKLGWTYIEDIGQHVGRTVTVKGWLYAKRSSGKIHFLQLRDGTGVIQGVMARNDVDERTFELGGSLTQESSIEVTGLVREDARAPSGYELTVSGLTLVQQAVDYPITPKEHGPAFLMEHRHLWLRSSKQHAILRVRDTIEQAIHGYLHSQGFIHTPAPILTPTACEGTTTLFRTDYFGEPAFLSQSGQMYIEATAAAFGKVYTFTPAFRAEKSKTRRHLTELWMMDAEASYFTHEENMQCQEEMVCAVVGKVLAECRTELKTLERDTAMLEKIKAPFHRISYKQAVELCKKANVPIEYGEDFGAPHDTAIAGSFDRPVFVDRFPTAIKSFYMQPDPADPSVVLGSDLYATEGYGEIIGGSERIHDLDLLLRKMEEHQVPYEPYKWYVDLRRYGSVPHAGFGIGIERTVSWICGLSHIRESIPFARMLEKIYP